LVLLPPSRLTVSSFNESGREKDDSAHRDVEDDDNDDTDEEDAEFAVSVTDRETEPATKEMFGSVGVVAIGSNVVVCSTSVAAAVAVATLQGKFVSLPLRLVLITVVDAAVLAGVIPHCRRNR